MDTIIRVYRDSSARVTAYYMTIDGYKFEALRMKGKIVNITDDQADNQYSNILEWVKANLPYNTNGWSIDKISPNSNINRHRDPNELPLALIARVN
ncbi:MAG: hypothetical protein R3321_00385 [Nitrososphaeraceae archaeon]|nr:hypothetical protein [Nitrososphaeraceae archaeon]